MSHKEGTGSTANNPHVSRAVQWLLALMVVVVAASAVATAVHVRAPIPDVQRVSSSAAGAAAPGTTSATDTVPHVAVRPAGDEPLRLAITDAEAAPAPAPAPPPARPRHVVLWGDSLAHESALFFQWAVQQSPDLTVETRTWGGTAPCDWYAEIMQWPDTQPIDVAVLEFSGNVRTPCMRADGRTLSGQERVDKYRADLGREALHLRNLGATVYVIGPPVFRPDFDPNRVEELNEMYAELAAEHEGISFVNAGEVVLAGGQYADRVPCAPWEGDAQGCVNGTITVRSPDGAHFCPTNFVDGSCPVFSPGAFRFAMAMAAATTTRT